MQSSNRKGSGGERYRVTKMCSSSGDLLWHSTRSHTVLFLSLSLFRGHEEAALVGTLALNNDASTSDLPFRGQQSLLCSEQ